MTTDKLSSLQQHYSAELSGLVSQLVSKPPGAFELCARMNGHMVHELEQQYLHIDSLDCLLSRECENGRLFSLLVKLGFVNERPSTIRTVHGPRRAIATFCSSALRVPPR